MFTVRVHTLLGCGGGAYGRVGSTEQPVYSISAAFSLTWERRPTVEPINRRRAAGRKNTETSRPIVVPAVADKAAEVACSPGGLRRVQDHSVC